MRIGLLDPSIDSPNIGDEIIAMAARREAAKFGDVHRYPTQRALTGDERAEAAKTSLLLVGGSNLLASDQLLDGAWNVGLRDARSWLMKRAVTLGVGWNTYGQPPTTYTKQVLQRALMRNAVHSVRDDHTRAQMASAGIAAINTSCVTTWDMPERPEQRTASSSDLVMTVTAWRGNPEWDRELICEAKRRFDRVKIWPQQLDDVDYVRKLAIDEIEFLPNTLKAFEDQLQAGADYLGTRLHGGIHALNLGARATIIAIDNRALELGQTADLPVSIDSDPRDAVSYAVTRSPANVSIPHSEIDAWRNATRALIAVPSATRFETLRGREVESREVPSRIRRLGSIAKATATRRAKW